VPNRQTALSRSNLAMCLSLLGQHTEALQLAGQVTLAQPATAKAWLDQGLIALHALEFDLARSALERARVLSPEDDPTRAAVALLEHSTPPQPEQLPAAPPTESQAVWLARVGRRPDALKSYLAVLSDPASSQAAVQSGAEYIVRFGSPELLAPTVLQYEKRLGNSAQPALRQAAEDRLQQTSRLRELWRRLPSLPLP
jgi:tetratricopeptide (TPR) repeat protein